MATAAAVVGTVGSIAGAAMSSSAADDAADAQVQAAQVAADVQREQYNKNLILLRPFMTTGAAATQEMAALMGLGGVDPYGSSFPIDEKYLNGGSTSSGSNNANTETTTTTTQYVQGLGYVPTRQYYNGATTYQDHLKNLRSATDQQSVMDYLRNRTNNPSSLGNEDYMYTPGQTVTTTTKTTGGNSANNTVAAPQYSRAELQQQAFDRFRASPDYNFRLNEGLKAVNASAAAKGGLLSGAALKATNNYAQNVASGEYGNYWNRLAQLAGYGQASINSATSLGQNTANNLSTIYQNAGDARASGYINSANAWKGGIQGVTNGVGTILGSMGGGYGSSYTPSAYGGSYSF